MKITADEIMELYRIYVSLQNNIVEANVRMILLPENGDAGGDADVGT